MNLIKTYVNYCNWLESKGIEQETRIYVCCKILQNIEVV